ncbi:MAG: response regulator [Spirochaetales bacterium]|nr:response regulator [Spirochaetales bacterium]
MDEKSSILIIDDDVRILDAMRDALDAAGFDVTIAVDGSQGLKMLEEVQFQLIISDIVMEDMGGIEFLRKIRKTGISTPVVIMSGDPIGENFFKSAKLLGACFCLQKPFTARTLFDVIQKILPYASE